MRPYIQGEVYRCNFSTKAFKQQYIYSYFSTDKALSVETVSYGKLVSLPFCISIKNSVRFIYEAVHFLNI